MKPNDKRNPPPSGGFFLKTSSPLYGFPGAHAAILGQSDTRQRLDGLDHGRVHHGGLGVFLTAKQLSVDPVVLVRGIHQLILCSQKPLYLKEHHAKNNGKSRSNRAKTAPTGGEPTVCIISCNSLHIQTLYVEYYGKNGCRRSGSLPSPPGRPCNAALPGWPQSAERE